MIASVGFRNYQALRSTRVDLGPFNLVIGPNGSGKTSLIEAILRLCDLAEQPLHSLASAPDERQRIEFGFRPPYDGIVVRLGCRDDLACDVIEISPADDAGWPALRAAFARIRSYALDHGAMAAAIIAGPAAAEIQVRPPATSVL